MNLFHVTYRRRFTVPMLRRALRGGYGALYLTASSPLQPPEIEGFYCPPSLTARHSLTQRDPDHPPDLAALSAWLAACWSSGVRVGLRLPRRSRRAAYLVSDLYLQREERRHQRRRRLSRATRK